MPTGIHVRCITALSTARQTSPTTTAFKFDAAQTERFDAGGNKLSGTVPQIAQCGYTGREPDETA